MIDADGKVLGRYRKSHIPDGPGYQEKYYFTPGDTGFKVWKTRFGTFGAAICWDQWFPEAARIMALKGAEVLFYPTAIGSEPPPAPPVDMPRSLAARDAGPRRGELSCRWWPPTASARKRARPARYASTARPSSPARRAKSSPNWAGRRRRRRRRFDFAGIAKARASWGLFRDRRPDLYKAITTSDGEAV